LKETMTTGRDAEAHIRLHVEADLTAGAEIAFARAQAHYLGRVMRLGPGAPLLLFNGRDGEWRARLESAGKNAATARVEERTRAPEIEPDLWLVFAPIKRTPIDYLAQKATELGVSALWPVFTQRTAVTRVNEERLAANLIEAAEQCGRLSVPALIAPAKLADAIARWPAERRLLLCDESGGGEPIAKALERLAPAPGPAAFLIGPEGGFAPTELDAIKKLPICTAVGLGPRLLRADTAALSALACWQALAGDWRAR
jgi:16S rRNA (uracil1498-N3)-methyltransferase